MLLLGVVQAQVTGAPAGGPSYDLLATEILTASQASVTFSSLGDYAADYQHLQIRAVTRTSETSDTREIRYRLNGDSGSKYAAHRLEGNQAVSAPVSASFWDESIGRIGTTTVSDASTGSFGAIVIDMLDPFETTKNTTLRGLSGAIGGEPGEARVILYSGLYNDTALITTITFTTELAANWLAGSRFSLYGLRN